MTREIRRGTPRDALVPMLVDRGLDEPPARQLVDTRYDALAGQVESERWTWPSICARAAAAGLVAAIVGGFVWGWIVRTTDYEIGFAAWGIGLLCGFAVLVAARGQRGLPLQVVAVLAAALGVAVGKYPRSSS